MRIPVTSIRVDAPQFQIAAKNPRRAELVASSGFVLAAAGFAGFGAAYWQNWSNFWLALTFSIGFAGLGYGMVVWGRYLMPRGPFSESRHSLVPTSAQREVFVQDFAIRGKVAVERRGFLVKTLGIASGILGVVLAFPLLRSLGPSRERRFAKPPGDAAPISSTSPVARSRRATSRWAALSRCSPRPTSEARTHRPC